MKISRFINAFFLLLGVALLAAMVLRLDYRQVGTQLMSIGWYFLAYFAFYVGGLVVTTLAWRDLIRPKHHQVGFMRLLGVFWTGHAINSLTPTGNLGELLKGTMLQGRVEGKELVASLVTFNFFSMLSLQVFALLGPLLCLLFLDIDRATVLIMLAVSLLFFLPTLVVYIIIRRGVVGMLLGLLRRLPVLRKKDFSGWEEKASEIDKRIKELRRDHPGRFRRAMLWLAAARVCHAGESLCLMLGLFPSQPLGWIILLALLVQTLRHLVSWIVIFIPGQVGAAEGGATLFFDRIGLPPHLGLALELLRRIGLTVGIGIGLLIGWSMGIRTKQPISSNTGDVAK